MTLNKERLYSPILYASGECKIGYVISSSPKEVRDRFSELMHMPWKILKKQGWKVLEVELIADERNVCPEEFLDE